MLAAIGAAFVVSSVAYSVSAPVYSFIDFGDSATPLWSAMAVGAIAGAAVARAAGGALGVVAFAAYLAAGAAITVGWEALYEQAIQGSSFYFITVSAVQLALWQVPSAIAVLVGSLASTRVTRGAQGTNAFLEAVGAYSFVAAIVMALVRGPIDPRLAPYTVVFAPTAIHVAFVVAEAIAAGAVLAWRWRGPMRPFAGGRVCSRGARKRDAGRLHDACRRHPLQLDRVLAAIVDPRTPRHGGRRARGRRSWTEDARSYSVNSPGAILSRPPMYERTAFGISSDPSLRW